jgi:hypothetical protein
MQHLRWLLAQGSSSASRMSASFAPALVAGNRALFGPLLWLRPAPLPKRGDSVTMHIDDPFQCLKSP